MQMPRKIENLHCGACMTEFKGLKKLNAHIRECPAARALLPYITKVWIGADKVGHPLSHFIQALHKNAHLIKSYAYAIADMIPDMQRAKLHVDLCEALGLSHYKFQPFTDYAGKKFPNRDEAFQILWEALEYELSDISKKS
jgi:hypothetical protein